MGLTLLNQLGEWNPQLFRELKGQLKRRNLFFTIAGSLGSQFLLFMVFSGAGCIDSACTRIEWDVQWQIVHGALNWLLPFLLIFGGTYLLLNDLGKEEHRGTLNFIRLSPQSPQSILTGKMLGVPALLYLGIILAIPLHGVSALVEGWSLHWLLAIYTLWGAGCYLFYSAAILVALLNRSVGGVQSQAWGGSLLAAFFGAGYISLINVGFNLYRSGLGLGDWHWWLLPLPEQPGLAYVWTLITLGVATHWIWQAAKRLFSNSRATLLSKRQSYWLVGSIQVWLLGFFLPGLNSTVSDAQLFIGFIALFVFNPVGFLVLSITLSPHRQALQDWARYRRDRISPLMQDLIWGEKSPALVAIAINLLITVTIWVPGILLLPHRVWQEENFQLHQVLVGLLLTMNLILIYAAIVEVMVFLKKSTQMLWTVGVAGAVLAWLLSIGRMGGNPLEMPWIWLFSPLPILALANASIQTIFLGLLAQWSVLGFLTFQLKQQLQKAGESTSKTLFVSDK